MQKKMKTTGVVCVCSRGLVHSRTIEGIDKNMNEVSGDWIRIFTHDKPIPEAQNSIVELARQYHPEWLWFVEEDVVPPDGVLQKLLDEAKECDVVAAKYKLAGGSWSHFPINGSSLAFAGLGCLLVYLKVFDRIGYPYFRIDRQFSFALQPAGKQKQKYGGQDVYFFAMLKKLKIKAKLLHVECQHLHVTATGDMLNNVGFHSIEAF
jgi:hypothetical protein